MLFYNFKDYEGFKELFGMQEHGNGNKSRRNKILLSYIKDPKWLKMSHSEDRRENLRAHASANITSMGELYTHLLHRISRECLAGNEYIRLLDFSMWSNQYHLDDYKGVCEDGDSMAVRYVRNDNGRVFKKRCGRFLRDVLMEHDFGKTLPEPVMKWLCEEFTQRWQTHVSSNMLDCTLHIGDDLDDFERIYSSNYCKGDFGSCMVDDDYHSFYKDAVKSRAAWLENGDEDIVARCIIYDDVEMVDDPEHRKLRLAERQYSSDCDELLKRVLVDKLIQAGEIDGYKKVGADCHSPRAFLWNDGSPLDARFRIRCRLDYGEPVSYQDSFKWFDMDEQMAYNFSRSGCLELDITDGELEDDRKWDSWHEEYTDSAVVTVYYHGRQYTCAEDELDDFVWIEREDAYYHTDDITYCDDIDDYVCSDDAYWSDLLEKYFAYSDNKDSEERDWYEDHGWTYSEWDDKWFEDEEDVVVLRRKNGYTQTISKESMEECYKVEYDDVAEEYVEL